VIFLVEAGFGGAVGERLEEEDEELPRFILSIEDEVLYSVSKLLVDVRSGGCDLICSA